MPKLIKFIKIFMAFMLFVFLAWFYTLDWQDKMIDTKLMGIPEACLDANGDGVYNSDDFNYGGVNFYRYTDNSFYLNDKKGSYSEAKQCDFNAHNNPYIDYITEPYCISYCRLKGWLRVDGYKIDYF